MARYNLIITPKAIKEIQNAVDYYNGQQKGLGKRFYADYKSQMTSLESNPYTRAIRYLDIRFAVLNKFPYAAHYSIQGKDIIVYAVLSMYQSPETSWVNK